MLQNSDLTYAYNLTYKVWLWINLILGLIIIVCGVVHHVKNRG